MADQYEIWTCHRERGGYFHWNRLHSVLSQAEAQMEMKEWSEMVEAGDIVNAVMVEKGKEPLDPASCGTRFVYPHERAAARGKSSSGCLTSLLFACAIGATSVLALFV